MIDVFSDRLIVIFLFEFFGIFRIKCKLVLLFCYFYVCGFWCFWNIFIFGILVRSDFSFISSGCGVRLKMDKCDIVLEKILGFIFLLKVFVRCWFFKF